MKKELPDEKVAALIIADIGKERLVAADRLAAIREKLASTGLDAGEWMLLADGEG